MKRSARHLWLIPPMWLTLVLTGVGIYGTGTLYKGLISHSVPLILLGLSVVLLTTLAVGTPLAYAQNLRREALRRRRERNE